LVLALIATGAFFAVGGLSGRVVSMYNYINTNYP